VRSSVRAIDDHISSLIPVLLDLTHYRTSVDVRLAAIDCLEALTSLPYTRLHPYKVPIHFIFHASTKYSV
jgi:hypothetical protein